MNKDLVVWIILGIVLVISLSVLVIAEDSPSTNTSTGTNTSTTTSNNNNNNNSGPQSGALVLVDPTSTIWYQFNATSNSNPIPDWVYDSITVSGSGQSNIPAGWTQLIASSTVFGPRIAVLIHGFDSDHRVMTSSAEFVSKYVFQNGTTYETILAYEYNYKLHPADLGTALNSDLQPLMRAGLQIDLFVHSMGGNVSRYAIEHGTKPLSNIQHVTMFGTPNDGLPGQVGTAFVAGLTSAGSPSSVVTAASLGDLVSGSSFLTSANVPIANSMRSRNHYYTIAGNRPNTLIPVDPQGDSLGELLNSVYLSLDPGMVDDGLVAAQSVFSNALTGVSQSWAQNPSECSALVNQDHFSMIGVKTQITPFGANLWDYASYIELPNDVQTALRKWMSKW